MGAGYIPQGLSDFDGYGIADYMLKLRDQQQRQRAAELQSMLHVRQIRQQADAFKLREATEARRLQGQENQQARWEKEQDRRNRLEVVQALPGIIADAENGPLTEMRLGAYGLPYKKAQNVIPGVPDRPVDPGAPPEAPSPPQRFGGYGDAEGLPRESPPVQVPTEAAEAYPNTLTGPVEMPADAEARAGAGTALGDEAARQAHEDRSQQDRMGVEIQRRDADQFRGAQFDSQFDHAQRTQQFQDEAATFPRRMTEFEQAQKVFRGMNQEADVQQGDRDRALAAPQASIYEVQMPGGQQMRIDPGSIRAARQTLWSRNSEQWGAEHPSLQSPGEDSQLSNQFIQELKGDIATGTPATEASKQLTAFMTLDAKGKAAMLGREDKQLHDLDRDKLNNAEREKRARIMAGAANTRHAQDLPFKRAAADDRHTDKVDNQWNRMLTKDGYTKDTVSYRDAFDGIRGLKVGNSAADVLAAGKFMRTAQGPGVLTDRDYDRFFGKIGGLEKYGNLSNMIEASIKGEIPEMVSGQMIEALKTAIEFKRTSLQRLFKAGDARWKDDPSWLEIRAGYEEMLPGVAPPRSGGKDPGNGNDDPKSLLDEYRKSKGQ